MPRGILTKEQYERQLRRIRSPENRKKLSESSKRMWQTKDMTERNKKISESKKGHKHPSWKGDKVDYASLHEWIRNNLPIPKKCQNCGKEKRLDAACITGNYIRTGDNWQLNWKYLCRSCHMKSDPKRLKT